MKYSIGLRVVIVNGMPESGKTTFENMCADILTPAFCRTRSTVDKIKEIAKEGGWTGTKNLEDRKFLSDLKDLFTDYNDMPFNDIIKFLKGWETDLEYYGVGSHKHVLFVDDREPEHIDRLKKELNAVTLLIEREEVANQIVSNHSDGNVYDYDYDYIIKNNGDLADLGEQALIFLNWIFS